MPELQPVLNGQNVQKSGSVKSIETGGFSLAFETGELPWLAEAGEPFATSSQK
jgi:hypothetical protein